MPKNRSSRSKKLARQDKARISRGVLDVPRITWDPKAIRAALDQVAVTGYFPMVGSDGQARQITYKQVRDWCAADLAAEGEPVLEPDEFTDILRNDLIFGFLRLRTDGLWESDQVYFQSRDET